MLLLVLLCLRSTYSGDSSLVLPRLWPSRKGKIHHEKAYKPVRYLHSCPTNLCEQSQGGKGAFAQANSRRMKVTGWMCEWHSRASYNHCAG